MRLSSARSLAFAFTLLLGVALAHAAENNDPAGRVPPRLSLIDGEVSIHSRDGSEWEHAEKNYPFAPGDYVATGPQSRAELQIGARAFVRLDGNSQLGLEVQDGGLLRFDMPNGRVGLDIRALARGSRVEVSTEDGSITISDPGFYDLTTSDDGTRFAALQGGRATIQSGSDSIDLRSGGEVRARRGDRLSAYDAPAPDGWIRWNNERTDRILQATSRSYVSDDVYGLRDLDDYGTWRDEPSYGHVWVPRDVPPTWAPYTTGRWVHDDFYGWTWVDTAHWGWAPYHYGRWVYVGSYWAWAPGPVVVRPVYSPALVAFFGGGHVSVGIGFPYVSWVALGWGEPVIPWWGSTHYRHRPCWDGWGGPTIVNNVYVDRRHYRERTVIRYRNEHERGAIVAVRRDDFGHRSVDRVRVTHVERRELRPMREGPPERREDVRPPRDRGDSRRPDRPDQGLGVRSRDARPPRPDRADEARRSRDPWHTAPQPRDDYGRSDDRRPPREPRSQRDPRPDVQPEARSQDREHHRPPRPAAQERGPDDARRNSRGDDRGRGRPERREPEGRSPNSDFDRQRPAPMPHEVDRPSRPERDRGEDKQPSSGYDWPSSAPRERRAPEPAQQRPDSSDFGSRPDSRHRDRGDTPFDAAERNRERVREPEPRHREAPPMRMEPQPSGRSDRDSSRDRSDRGGAATHSEPSGRPESHRERH